MTTNLTPIQAALRALAGAPALRDPARALFGALGYRSEKHFDIVPNTALGFQEQFGITLKSERALTSEWLTVDFLFQFTDDEIHRFGQQTGQAALLDFASGGQVDNARIESYLFFAIRLRGEHYTRTQLATITRELNVHFPMPILVLFQHGETLTIAIINRRIHKRDPRRDVLEKVTLIKDINAASPHRAHLDILEDLSLPALAREHPIGNFVELQRAWEYVLSSSELNKRFYREIANWYFWATQHVTFPAGSEPDEARRNDISIIRLITRLIFVWFLKEKGLVPADLFREWRLTTMLADMSPEASSYYKAILQNLFFATLNREMGKRGFRKKTTTPGGRDQNRLVTDLYRYQDYFTDGGDALLSLMSNIPFLNGGLFECLDYEKDQNEDRQVVRIDGFSDEAKNPLSVPNMLFFADEQEVDLHRFYGTSGGTSRRAHKVRGLIPILNRYKFTVTENTPIEEEIALDPELLGQVFENLLAAYNPETGATARKQTGSFYTPREVVNYMVDESLLAYLETALSGSSEGSEPLAARLRHLLAYTNEPPQFDDAERAELIAAIDRVKILDPACGSGAFPIGILQKLVFLLGKLDPGNQQWKQRQIDNVHRDMERARTIEDTEVRETALASLEQKLLDIERAFAYDTLDYGRKLYLIQNGIYGVDIQPIAVQIAKLRCFIALIVDQQTDDSLENRGLLALPNLETRFVAANTLLSTDIESQTSLRSDAVLRLEQELATVRQRHFDARTPATKRKYREEDRRIREKIGHELKRDGVPGATANMLARWDPYNQNATVDFFDPLWMFTVDEGFDIVLGNPPYVRQEKIRDLKPRFKDHYTCYTGAADLYVYFYERAIDLLKPGGILTYISSNKYFRAGYGKKLRQYLGSKTTIHQLIDFGDAPVFTAIAYPSIIITRKGKPDSNDLRAITWEPADDVTTFARVFADQSFPIAQRELTADGWRLEPPTVLRLLEKLRNAGTPLGEYVQGRFYYGIKTGYNEAFVVDRATRDRLIAEDPASDELLKPFLRGRDVKRWRVQSQDLWLIFTRRGVDIEQYPAIYEHLLQYKDRLENRAPGNYEWYELQASPGDTERFEEPKIVIPAITQNVSYAPDFEGHFCNDKTSVCVANDIDYLLGLLNSKLMWWFIRQIAATKQGGFLEFKPMYVSQIPIPAATPSEQAPIIALVERILEAKREDAGADVSALEAEIDEHVYRLYGLTGEERGIVEGE